MSNDMLAEKYLISNTIFEPVVRICISGKVELTVSRRYRTEIANPSSVLKTITNKNVAIHIDPSMKLNLSKFPHSNPTSQNLIIWSKSRDKLPLQSLPKLNENFPKQIWKL